jgi:hypothetical protein
MPQPPPNPADLVRTEADRVPPPDVTVPEKTVRSPSDNGRDLLLDVKRLADRAGGLEKLRELMDVLAQLKK